MSLVRLWVRRLAAVLVAVGALSSPAWLLGTAYAADSLTVAHVSGTRITVNATVAKLSRMHLSDADIKATVGTRAVRAHIVRQSSTSSDAAIQQSVVILLDTSGSMRGAPLTAAITSARRFVTNLPDGVSVGVMTFEHTVHLLARPTDDRGAAIAALNDVTAGGDTSLYDGIVAADQALGNEGDRRIVVLSDGGDSASTATLSHAAALLSTHRTRLTAIAFGHVGNARHALDTLAAAGHGTVLGAADAPALARAFAKAGQQFTGHLTVSVPIPAGMQASSVHVTLNLPTVHGRTTVATTAVLQKVHAAARAPRVNRWLLGAGLAGVGIGLALLVALGWSVREHSAGRGAQARRMVNRYSLGGATTQPNDESPLGTTRITRTALEFAGRVIAHRDYEQRLALRLDRAGVALRPAEWVLLQGGVTAVSLLFGMLLQGPLLAVGFAVVLGLVVPQLALAVLIARRRSAFQAQLPDALTVVAGSLGAGYSLAQALDTVVREGAQPFAGEMSRALAASRIGIPLEDALDEVAERMQVRDFAWVVMAVRTQRQVGGNLSEILRTVAGTMRERAQLRRHVRALSAEGRLSAYILIGLPILMALYEFGFRRDYIRPLYTTGLGLVMLATAVALVVIGAIWMAKLVKVEV